MISIIVPFYNAEAYIGRCIESILAQTYSDFELLLVSDGSNDSSVAICEDYCKRDKRVKIVQKENGGVSTARNKGLDLAKGEYVAFVDSDDYLLDDYLQNSMDIINEYDVDIVRTPYIRKIGKKESIQKFNIPYNKVIKKEDYVSEIYSNIGKGNTIDTACLNVIRRSVIGGIRFNEKISYAEDTLFMINVLESSRNGIYCLDKPSYVYVYNKNEATTLFASEKWVYNIQNFKDVFIKEAFHIIRYNHPKFNIEPLREKYRNSINGIIHMSIVSQKRLEHKKFVEKVVHIIDDEGIGLDWGYISKIRKTYNPLVFLVYKVIYGSKKAIYNRLARKV